MNDRIDEGLWSWKQSSNNNRMISLQRGPAHRNADHTGIKLAYFGGSCFRITTPSGLILMIDPWRNLPSGNADWFLFDFPKCAADIALSTHAHFDHDNLHTLDTSTLIDRLVGRFEFADVTVTGIADKHATDSSHCASDWVSRTEELTPIRAFPPNNWRSFDNSLLLIETAGLRIVHWGDNRADPPEEVWSRLGHIDILLLPIDGSFHVLSEEHIVEVRRRLAARITIPHHYLIPGIIRESSTLLPPDGWMARQTNAEFTETGEVTLTCDKVKSVHHHVLCFGPNVAFDPAKERSRAAGEAGTE